MQIEQVTGDVFEYAEQHGDAAIIWMRSGFNAAFAHYQAFLGRLTSPDQIGAGAKSLSAAIPLTFRPWKMTDDSRKEHQRAIALDPPLGRLRFLCFLENRDEAKALEDQGFVSKLCAALDEFDERGCRAVAMMCPPPPVPQDVPDAARREMLQRRLELCIDTLRGWSRSGFARSIERVSIISLTWSMLDSGETDGADAPSGSPDVKPPQDRWSDGILSCSRTDGELREEFGEDQCYPCPICGCLTVLGGGETLGLCEHKLEELDDGFYGWIEVLFAFAWMFEDMPKERRERLDAVLGPEDTMRLNLLVEGELDDSFVFLGPSVGVDEVSGCFEYSESFVGPHEARTLDAYVRRLLAAVERTEVLAAQDLPPLESLFDRLASLMVESD
jgi:hypothetical protein